LLAVGQVLFKIAASNIEKNTLSFFSAIFSPQLIFALFIYAIATLMWVYALRTTSLKLAYPFVALAFIVVPLLGHWFLNERIGINTIIGAVLIMLGVVVSVYK
jgi:drug/metabolite transporter (DMT)-like permease